MDISLLNTQSHLPVVGIDLSGSEKKPSGFCVLKDGHAITQRVKSDQEILALISGIKPVPGIIGFSIITSCRQTNTI